MGGKSSCPHAGSAQFGYLLRSPGVQQGGPGQVPPSGNYLGCTRHRGDAGHGEATARGESGTGLGAAEKAILRQNDEYGYRQLGLRASLKEDRLQIEGTAEKGDKKYFIVGSLLGGIDIQLVSPDKGLSFNKYIDYFKKRLGQMKLGGPSFDVD